MAHFTHALTTKHDGICIPATTPPLLPQSVPWLLPWPPLQPRHTTATLQHSNNATLITHAIILPTAETKQMVGCCVVTCLLAHFCSLCCPYLHKLMLSPHPTDTLRGHDCLPPNKQNSKERSNVSFLFTIPPYINISPFNFSIKLLLPDEPSQSLPQLRHTPATRAHQRHHPPAIEWGRQKRLVFLFYLIIFPPFPFFSHCVLIFQLKCSSCRS